MADCVTAKNTGLSRTAKRLRFYSTCTVTAYHSFMDANRRQKTVGSEMKDGLLINKCSSDQSISIFVLVPQASVPTRCSEEGHMQWFAEQQRNPELRVLLV